MAAIKAEMKKSSSYTWLETAGGSIQQVEEEVAMCCPMIREEVLKGVGSSKNNAIRLPEGVNPEMLSLIFDYCRFHLAKGRSDMEHKTYDENLIRMDPKKLGELTSVAYSLQLKPLVDLTTRAFARMITGMCTREEMREICHFPYDRTEEEKLKPLKNTMNDPRIRLLNRLNAKKLKELKEGEKLKSVAVEEEEEERSVDDLLSFINGEDDDPKVVKKKTSKSKKKKNKQKIGTSTGGTCEEASEEDSHSPSAEIVDKTESSFLGDVSSMVNSKKKKKNKKKNGTSTGTCEASEKDSHNICSKSPSAEIVDKTESSFLGDEIVDKTESSLGDEIVDKTESNSLGDKIVDDSIDDGDVDDEIDPAFQEIDDGDVDAEIDPALQEIVDREVEDFARRLNLDEIAR